MLDIATGLVVHLEPLTRALCGLPVRLETGRPLTCRPDGSFGAALTNWRRGRGWSQRQLAAELEVSDAAISYLETAQRRPSAKLLRRLQRLGFASVEPPPTPRRRNLRAGRVRPYRTGPP